jgi:hypothetical protein
MNKVLVYFKSDVGSIEEMEMYEQYEHSLIYMQFISMPFLVVMGLAYTV